MSGERTPTNVRALLILETISQADHPLTPTEINTSLNLPKQSIHRLCSALVNMGFLARDETGKRLRPSLRMREMANGILAASNAHILRHQILQRISNEIGETVNFVMPEDGGMRYRDRIDTDWPIRIQLPIGSAVPFHATASGKVYLASLTPQARRKMVESLDLRAMTNNTLTSVDPILEELRRVRKQGYATDRQEFMEGMVAVAVPVNDGQGRYFASIAVHGPSQRLTLELALEHLEVLQAGAEQLSVALFSGDDG